MFAQAATAVLRDEVKAVPAAARDVYAPRGPIPAAQPEAKGPVAEHRGRGDERVRGEAVGRIIHCSLSHSATLAALTCRNVRFNLGPLTFGSFGTP